MPRNRVAIGLVAAFSVAASGFAAVAVPAQEAATPAAAAYASLVEETPGLAAYWRLDEAGGGVAADSSGAGNDATYAAGVRLGEPGLIEEANAAIGLPGTEDGYADAGDVLDFPEGAPFTLEAWIRLDEFATPYPRLLMKEATDAEGDRQGYLLYISEETGRLGFERWRDGEANVVTTIDPVPVGVPTHVVAVYDGQAMRLYIDGEGVAEVPAGLGLIDTPYPFRIGARADDASPFAGAVDEVAVYETALDAETIQAHFRAGAAGRPAASPVATADGATPVAIAAEETPRPTPAAVTPAAPPDDDEEVVAVATAAVIATAAPAATIAVDTAPGADEPTPTAESEASAAPTTAVTIDALNLRAVPGTDAAILLVIPAGETVTVIGDETNGFVAVEYAGASGWVAAEFLDLGAAAGE